MQRIHMYSYFKNYNNRITYVMKEYFSAAWQYISHVLQCLQILGTYSLHVWDTRPLACSYLCALSLRVSLGDQTVKNLPAKQETGSVPGSGWSPGEGNGYSFQCSCLENSMDIEAWWVTVHGNAESDITERVTSPLNSILLRGKINLEPISLRHLVHLLLV